MSTGKNYYSRTDYSLIASYRWRHDSRDASERSSRHPIPHPANNKRAFTGAVRFVFFGFSFQRYPTMTTSARQRTVSVYTFHRTVCAYDFPYAFPNAFHRSIDRSIDRATERPAEERTNESRRYASDAPSIKRNVRAHIAKLIVSNWISYSRASAYIREHRIPCSIRRMRAYDARCIEIIPSIKATKRDQLVNNLIDESSCLVSEAKNPRDRDNEITNRHVRQSIEGKFPRKISISAERDETGNGKRIPPVLLELLLGRIRALERRKISRYRWSVYIVYIVLESNLECERDPVKSTRRGTRRSGALAPPINRNAA